MRDENDRRTSPLSSTKHPHQGTSPPPEHGCVLWPRKARGRPRREEDANGTFQGLPQISGNSISAAGRRLAADVKAATAMGEERCECGRRKIGTNLKNVSPMWGMFFK
jgi:hypothetical protein